MNIIWTNLTIWYLDKMIIEATKYAFHRSFRNYEPVTTVVDNFISTIDAKYVSLVDNKHYSRNRIFFFLQCFTQEQFTELNNKHRGEVRVVDWLSYDNMLVLESFNVKINKCVTIQIRKGIKNED